MIEMEEPATGTSSALLSNSTYPGITEELLNRYANDSYFGDSLRNSTAIHYELGPQRDSLYIVVPVTIIYVSILLTGTIGNISTCIVIARNKSMHTATNYYLFSLAVSDLLLLISGLPAEIYMVWCKYPYIFGEEFCVLRGLAAETSTNASVLTITAFTVERYVAICHPFLSQTMSKLTRAIKLILVIWLVALSFALPQALQFGVVQSLENPNFVMCTVERTLIQHSFELSTFLFFVVPMSLITVLYALIGLKLRKSNMLKRNPGKVEAYGSCRHHTGRSSRRVLKMLVAVVIAFFICWAPFHVQRLVAIYGTKKDHLSSKSKWMAFLYLLMTYTSGVFYYVSTTINPILYNIMSNKFRVAFMETLSRSCRAPGLAIRNEQRSYSSLSRSQQKTGAAYGSRIIGTAGTGVVQESTECSANSNREGSPKRPASVGEQPTDNSTTRANSNTKKSEVRSNGSKTRSDLRLQKGNLSRANVRDSSNGCAREQRYFENRSGKSRRKNDEVLRSKSTRYTAVKISNVDASSKKWWRLLKWLPGLKSLKLNNSANYSVPESRVLENPGHQKEEFSMTMWNICEANDQRPV